MLPVISVEIQKENKNSPSKSALIADALEETLMKAKGEANKDAKQLDSQPQ